MNELWKIEDRGPTSNAAALEAMTFRCDSTPSHAPRQFVCTNKKTGKVLTIVANDRLEALAKAREDKELAKA